MENKLQKTYPTDYNLLTVQDLRQAHFQTLSIISLMEFIKLNVNLDITMKLKYKDCERYLEYKSYKDDLIEHKCLCCNKNYKKKFDEKLKKIIGNPYKHFNNDINKFISLLRKGVCLYEYIHDWEKSDEASLPGKNFF